MYTMDEDRKNNLELLKAATIGFNIVQRLFNDEEVYWGKNKLLSEFTDKISTVFCK